MNLSGWGRYPRIEANVIRPRDLEALQDLLAGGTPMIARGNGRAYGDSAIQPSCTVEMCRLNRMLAFDPETGQLIAEAGVLLADIIATFGPRGWFPAVVPGTKLISLGGAIAADIHGKNHHQDGSFRACVDWIELIGPEGDLRRCSPEDDPALFDHTLGGMGLTGIILRAAIRLRRVETGWIRQRVITTGGLAQTMEALQRDASYSAAWIDAFATGPDLGRAVVTVGEPAEKADLPQGTPEFPPSPRKPSLPFDLPGFILNPNGLRLANLLYHRRNARLKGERLVSWDSFFHPLDAIGGWNRLYGKRGFVQFQCVVPPQTAEPAIAALLAETAAFGGGAYLAVLKRLGPQDSAFSFPMEGYTLALDFPANHKTFALMERLDAITLAHKGRFYLAKDSRMTAETLRAADPRAASFRAFREARGMADRFRSAQSERLGL